MDSYATTSDHNGSPTTQNIEVNNLRNLEHNLIASENQIIQNENQVRDAIGVIIEGMRLQRDNDNPDDEENEFENEAESEQSRMVVEQALQAMHFQETKGFYLKYSGVPCCPSLSLSPSILGSGLFSVSPRTWAISGSSNAGCFCCFMPASWSWQTITLKQLDQEVLNFIYRPQIWNCFGGTKDRIVDIYIPQRNERIGWIKYNASSEDGPDGALITDCVSKSVFVAGKIVDHPTPGYRIYDSIGIPVAVAQASRGITYRGLTTWTNFDFQYSPLAANMSASAKAVLSVGFLMWVLTLREKSGRKRCLWFLGSILLGFLIAAIIINFNL